LTPNKQADLIPVINGTQLIPLTERDRQVPIHPKLAFQGGDADPGTLIAGFDGEAVGAALFGDDKSLSLLLG
jgi:hypothetical protein